MIVQVDTSEISALEAKLNEATVLLMAVVSRGKGQKVVLAVADVDAVGSGKINIEQVDGSMTLTYEPGPPQ